MSAVPAMQRFARDHQGDLVDACCAERRVDYFCLECRDKVRLRSGLYRQKHYYHLPGHSECRQSGKSLVHLRLQEWLLEQLPLDEAAMEAPMPAIGRIADLHWRTKNIVFEIQCSPISGEEIKARTRDYRSLGLTVVWILHDATFNQQRVSSAELALESPFYFTNRNAAERGLIYDQWDLWENGWRHHRSEKHPVDLTRPREGRGDLPQALVERRPWDLYFSGDLVDRHLSGHYAAPNRPNLLRLFLRPYTAWLQLMLEKLSN